MSDGIGYSSFKPDWVKIYTAAQAEKDLDGFKFKGPGFYSITASAPYAKQASTSTMLVIALDRPLKQAWAQKFTATERFEFNYYDSRSPADAFNAIVNAPTRE